MNNLLTKVTILQGSDKTERRTPYLLQHAYGVMIANSAIGNLWVLPDFFQFILGFAGAQDWADAANHYLDVKRNIR